MDVDKGSSDVHVVHPELYSKCRLCIQEVGQIRTLPAIQEQIKFCFDIMVMPNDYLPQLLCIKCSNILANYCHLKKKYIENQKILQFKLNPLKEISEARAAGCTASHIPTPDFQTKPTQKEPCMTNEVVENLLPAKKIKENGIENDKENKEASKSRKVNAKDSCGKDNSSNEKNKKHQKNKVKRKRIRLQSDSEEDDFTTTKSKDDEVLNRSWTSLYRKKIVCRFCGKNFPTKRSFNIHFGSHSNLIKQYNAVINKHCMVTMNKVDCLPNITGSNKNVAVFNGTVISDKGNSTFYHSFVINNENLSGDESISTPQERHKRKRQRVESDSSTDIETKQSKKNKKNTEPEPSKSLTEYVNSDIQCINIDDTSSDTCDSSTLAKTGKEYDLGVINSIVNTYYNKYAKDKKGKREDNDVMLCRKLLSTGRKIMSGHGIQAPGLLKYLEQKNLALSWYPINTQIYQGMKTNYVRIITKIVEKSEDNLLAGWNIVKVNEDLLYDEESDHTTAEITLNPITTEKDSLLTKLLNANPVANPKQLPKKINSDIQTVIPATPRRPIAQLKNADEIFIDLDDDNDDMLMPVIMSTESLASQVKPVVEISETVSLKNKENNKNETNAFETSDSVKDCYVPRIKCKPVSELMPQTSQNFNIISSNVPLVVTQPVITINQPILTLSPQTSAVSQFQNTINPTIENTILQSVNNMLHPANSTQNTINIISKSVNGISQQANPLSGPEYPISGLTNAVIQLSNSVIQSNGSASTISGVVSQPVPTQQLPPWSRANLQGVSVVPAVEATDAPLILHTEKAAQPSTALTQTASTPVPPTSTQPNIDCNNALNGPTTPEAYEVIMNSVYLPNMPTSKPVQYFQNVLIMHDLKLLIETNNVLPEGFVCLVKYKLNIKQLSKRVYLGIAFYANVNQFCIKVRKPNHEEMDIDSLAAYWQMEILKSFLGEVTDKLLHSSKKISPALHDNIKQFLSLLKTIDIKNCPVQK